MTSLQLQLQLQLKCMDNFMLNEAIRHTHNPELLSFFVFLGLYCYCRGIGFDKDEVPPQEIGVYWFYILGWVGESSCQVHDKPTHSITQHIY